MNGFSLTALAMIIFLGLCLPAVAEEAEPLTWEVLQELLPEAPSGWTGAEPGGETLSSPQFSASVCRRSYDSESTGEKVDVHIVDTAYGSATPWESRFDNAFEYSSADGHIRRTEVAGNPAIDVYEAPDDYQLLVKVSDRFFVLIESESEEARDLFAGLVDYSGVAGLE